jgi:hypothetical protein
LKCSRMLHAFLFPAATHYTLPHLQGFATEGLNVLTRAEKSQFQQNWTIRPATPV